MYGGFDIYDVGGRPGPADRTPEVNMFWFKLCPRCSGDLFEDRDQYGQYITCMQCGFSRDVPTSEGGVLVISAEPVPIPVAPTWDGTRRRRISHGGRHFSKTLAFAADELSETAA